MWSRKNVDKDPKMTERQRWRTYLDVAASLAMIVAARKRSSRRYSTS
jgi:hypothetical protein